MTGCRRLLQAFTVCTLWLAASASAHEVRPAYLEIKEIAAQQFSVTWKQPILGDRRLPIDPVLPDTCELIEQGLPVNTGDALIQRWQTQCDLTSGTVHISGLTRTLTDVLIRVTYLNGDTRSQLLRSDSPEFDLGDSTPALGSYLFLGIDHLLLGIDHILFVIGLVLFIRDRWMLLKTITAFTLAHSITLAASVLELVTLPQQPVEAVIALSILFLARELVIPESERSMVMKIRPWLMAFVFGLLHGFGFAGALSDIGLPGDQLALALVLFNVGSEIGQGLVIATLLAGAWFWRRLPAGRLPIWQQTFSIIMGAMAGYWTIDRVAVLI
jgi:hydrogenase/urease accessory protein HupE